MSFLGGRKLFYVSRTYEMKYSYDGFILVRKAIRVCVCMWGKYILVVVPLVVPDVTNRFIWLYAFGIVYTDNKRTSNHSFIFESVNVVIADKFFFCFSLLYLIAFNERHMNINWKLLNVSWMDPFENGSAVYISK